VSGDIRAIVEAASRAAQIGAPASVHEIGGGSAAAYCVQSEARRAFLKIGPAAHPFDAEAQALEEIAATATLRVPRVLACGIESSAGYLLLEWIDLAASGDWAAAGRQLARLHACTRPNFGWPRANTIGGSPQFNAPSASWAVFYRQQRLRPQFALTAARGLQRLAALEAKACAAADALLDAHAPQASLLHGDLWRGNLAFDEYGQAVVFDPATYCGDAETDLAMSRLFGGFAESFYRAYADERPLLPGAGARLTLYQLYHVLNHANLFGGGYVAQAIAMIEQLDQCRRR
jgi:fructosamine-3-kinase